MTEEQDTKKRGKYTTKKSLELEALLTAAKEFEFTPKSNSLETKKHSYDIAELTKGVCLYPNRFLNDDNTCVNCHLFEYCACSSKTLGKKKRNE